MQVLIIEDELPAARQLAKLIGQHRPHWRVTDTLDAVSSAVRWLQHAPALDLIFMDIQIADGLSFDIFRQVEVRVPVIFTTAFDHYAVQAFKVNALDYLLKPVDPEDFEKALQKFEKQSSTTPLPDFRALAKMMKTPIFKERFLIKNGQQFQFLTTSEIAFFTSSEGLTQAHVFSGKKFFVENTLDELERLLDPNRFFRINRSMIIALESIQKIITHFNGRLKIETAPKIEDAVFVSRERVTEFKTWLGGN